jgi:glucose-6-phosphate isomerase, archaeal
MLYPEGVTIDGATGEVTPSTSRYNKKLSDLRGFFRDEAAFDAMIAEGDPTVYEVVDYRKEESDLAFGTTIMSPGKVGDEFFLTRGHFHVRRECGEAYYTQSGTGVLLLESRDGETRTVEMKPGVCAFIPPDWAHRSINTGSDKLIFTWFCATDAGHEYGEIADKGMRKLVVDQSGRAVVVDNPKYAGKV